MYREIKNIQKIQDLKLLVGEYALNNLLNRVSINNLGDIHCLTQYGINKFTNEKQSYLIVAIYVYDNFCGDSYYVYANGVFLYKVIENYDKINLFLNDLMSLKQLHTEKNYYKNS